jgi:hypothetical protein
VFPIYDEEMGDVYVKRGYGGTLKLLAQRTVAEHPLYSDEHIRRRIAALHEYGRSPGDLT